MCGLQLDKWPWLNDGVGQSTFTGLQKQELATTPRSCRPGCRWSIVYQPYQGIIQIFLFTRLLKEPLFREEKYDLILTKEE